MVDLVVFPISSCSSSSGQLSLSSDTHSLLHLFSPWRGLIRCCLIASRVTCAGRVRAARGRPLLLTLMAAILSSTTLIKQRHSYTLTLLHVWLFLYKTELVMVTMPSAVTGLTATVHTNRWQYSSERAHGDMADKAVPVARQYSSSRRTNTTGSR